MKNAAQLAAPHEGICVAVETRTSGFCLVTYTCRASRSLEALHAAGCITDGALAMFSTPTRVYVAEFGICHRSRVYPRGWTVTWETSLEKARTMPGVRAALRTAPEEEVSWHERAAKRIAAEMKATAIARRRRTVGRFRREVAWTTVDGILIVPNWQQIQARPAGS
ncbi:MAG TPA: hypothetical protein VJQ52_24640 [Steroidobacteraceae bacterium]|nr:hypothetical protein [Steroidobacteraceae bacterium]